MSLLSVLPFLRDLEEEAVQTFPINRVDSMVCSELLDKTKASFEASCVHAAQAME